MVPLGEKFLLVKYLWSGASGVVYETEQNYAVKFFHNPSAEIHTINFLNEKNPTDVLLQQVVDSTYASELVLIQLADCKESVHENESYMYVIDSPCILLLSDLISVFRTMYVFTYVIYSPCILSDLISVFRTMYMFTYVIYSPCILSDLVSVFRTMYMFTFRISNRELDGLMGLRANGEFIEIIAWWKMHLSKQAQDAETRLVDFPNESRKHLWCGYKLRVWTISRDNLNRIDPN